jgi:hypothetical protein
MRLARELRSLLRLGRRRGYRPLPARPGRRSDSSRGQYLAAGGVISGAAGARRFALELVRSEIRAGTYLSEWRLQAALDRLIAGML